MRRAIVLWANAAVSGNITSGLFWAILLKNSKIGIQ